MPVPPGAGDRALGDAQRGRYLSNRHSSSRASYTALCSRLVSNESATLARSCVSRYASAELMDPT